MKKNSNQFKLSMLVDRLSHELRTPLSAILGYSELLEKSDNLSDEEKDHLKKISVSGGQLLDVINDIIEISNIESGYAKIEEDRINSKDIINELKDKFKAQARLKEIHFQISADASVSSFFRTDEKKLKTILFSLINNAIKFTEKGRVSVTLKMITKESNHILSAEILDKGIGIKTEELKHVFSPFWQAEHENNTGTGLGLTTSKKLVEILGGNITIESKWGEGTCVRFEIPVKIDQTSKSLIPIHEIQSQYSKTKETLTALIVDDLPVNRTLARIMLEMKNFNIIEAENGEQALEHYHSNKPDVVLMDISMPIMNGVEAMEHIRQIKDSGDRIPIIAITAGGHAGSRSELIERGFSEYIQKPFTERELFEKLSIFLPTVSDSPKAPLQSSVI